MQVLMMFPIEMSHYEYISLLIQVLNFAIMIFVVIYAARQLRQSTRIHRDQLSWHIRTVTAQELKIKPRSNILDLNTDKYNKPELVLTYKEDVDELVKIILNNRKIRMDVHHALNIYERFARGIKFGIYDEEMVKKSNYKVMQRTYTMYKSYIIWRQQNVNPKAWEFYVTMLQDWNKNL